MTVPVLKHINHSYRDGPEATILNTVDVWLPETNLDGTDVNGTWVIYIHGGAWRDPLVDSMSFKRTVDILTTTKTTSSLVVGLASINYRLSPYPDHHSNPSFQTDPARNAKHPDHLNDVTRALVFLEKTYGINERYLLVGHSCGATMAFQIPVEGDGMDKTPQPLCIVGSEGIYNLPSLLETHQDSPFYKEFVVAAFGSTESAWDKASPYIGESSALWTKTNVLLISHSDEDELVETEQSLQMLSRISKMRNGRGHVAYVPASGKHDEIHETGQELARIITVGLKCL